MAQESDKPEEQKEPLTLTQSKAKKLIEELTEKSLEEKETKEGNIAKEFLQGIWHGNAISRSPSQKTNRKGDKPEIDKRGTDTS